MQLVEALAVPLPGRQRQQVGVIGGRGRTEVGGDLADLGWVEPVDVGGGRPQQLGPVDHVGDGRRIAHRQLCEHGRHGIRRRLGSGDVRDHTRQQQRLDAGLLARAQLGDELVEPGDGGEPQEATGVELAGIMSAAVQRGSDVRKRPLEHTGDVEEAHRPGVAGAQHLEEEVRVVWRPAQRRRASAGEPLEQLVRRPGLSRHGRRLEGDGHDRRQRRPTVQHDLPVVDGQPPAGRALGDAGVQIVGEEGAAALLESPPQQWRRDERRQQHDEDQRPVELLVEHTLAQPDAGEDQPDFAARQHADADEQAIGPPAGCAQPRHQLPDGGHGEQRAGDQQPLRPEHRAEVGVDADQHEEHRHEHSCDAVEVGCHPLGVTAAADGQPGHEGADDERQLGGVGEQGEAQDQQQGHHRQRGTGSGHPMDDIEQARDDQQPDDT